MAKPITINERRLKRVGLCLLHHMNEMARDENKVRAEHFQHVDSKRQEEEGNDEEKMILLRKLPGTNVNKGISKNC